MASRRCRPHTSPALGPLDDDDLLGEILLRLPPKPTSLPRASFVCKRWQSIATDAAFRRRFRTHHRKLPILGVFEAPSIMSKLKFMPLLDPPDRIPSERFSLNLAGDEYNWKVLGCRHGRVLLINWGRDMLLVFEPVSGDMLRIPIPPEFDQGRKASTDAAVLCAAGNDQDHVHGDCHSSPFKVVVVGIRPHDKAAIAQVYSQETGMWMWGDLLSTSKPCTGRRCRAVGRSHPSILIGDALYLRLNGYEDCILKFDLDNRLTLIDGPPIDPVRDQGRMIRAEDGSLGLAIFLYPTLKLWHRKVNCHGVATWVTHKTFNMDEMLGPQAKYAHIAGYAEDADAIFMLISDPSQPVLVIVHLESVKVEKYPGARSYGRMNYHPFTNFYTAGIAGAWSTPPDIGTSRQQRIARLIKKYSDSLL
ncbi:unnamed protein product [Alopecurus aequalis]